MKHCADPVSVKRWLRVISLLICSPVVCQDIGVGTWRTHFSYQNARITQVTSDKVFCAAENGFFTRDLTTGETRKLSKIDGLSDARITAMAYNSSSNVLVVGYESGVIDLIYDDRIVGIRDIATSSLNRDKRINDISAGGSLAYIASDFGVVVIDLERAEIIENYLQIGEAGADVVVEEIEVREEELFVRTAEGIQSGSLSENLLDFNNWTRFAGTSDYTNLTASDDQLYATEGLRLFYFDGSQWTDTGSDMPMGGAKLFDTDDRLFTASDGVIYQLENAAFEIALNSSATQINDLTVAQDGSFMIADAFQGLIDQDGNSLSPDGPLADEYSRIRVVEEQVFAFNAPSPDAYDGSQEVPAYALFSEGIWSSASIEGFSNVSDVTSFNGTRYFTSVGSGLYIEGSGIVEDVPNSAASLDSVLTGVHSNESLYITGYHEQPLHIFDASGSWSSYNGSQVFNDKFVAVDVAQRDIIWLLADDGSLTVFDPSENQGDILNTGDGLPSAISSFTISVEDNVWLASPGGPAFFPDASFIFSSTEAIRPTFENRLLFDREVINAVLTDGGNRIWFGTERGLWVFDENTSQLEALFDESNSPLPSDVILSLAYNERSGEVFIVTEKGMVSYRSASSRGTAVHASVKVFPNPVRPDFQGQVGISGLANNVTLKITDLNGNLVREVRSNGGTASWDLLSVNGSEVVTGIYYFFSSTFDGEETFVGKLAVIR